MELIIKYFPGLDSQRLAQFNALGELYREWNEKINVISRKDIDQLYLHHVLHSLAVAKYNPFHEGIEVVDVGTGGGFPGIPLAIMFPEVQFTLLDATAKKIRVVSEIAAALSLSNVKPVHARAEAYTGAFDLCITRAVSTLTQIVAWTQHMLPSAQWIALKGGDQREIRKELPPLFTMEFIPVSQYFSEPYFNEKYIIKIHREIRKTSK